MSQMGRVHPVTKGCFRTVHREGLLCGGELGGASVMCRPTVVIKWGRQGDIRAHKRECFRYRATLPLATELMVRWQVPFVHPQFNAWARCPAVGAQRKASHGARAAVRA